MTTDPGGNERDSDDTMTRREYLLIVAFSGGADPFLAAEAVASTLLANPEWDPEERRTFAQWGPLGGEE